MGLSAADLKAMHSLAPDDDCALLDRPEVSAPAPQRVTGYPNQFPGVCTKCNQRVEAGGGFRKRNDGPGPRWVVFHGTCPEIVAVVSTSPAAGDSIAAKRATPAIHPGDFTIETDSGHRTFQVKFQAEDAEFAPGELLIAFLNGPSNESDFATFGFVKGTPDRPRVAVWSRFRDSESLNADLATFLADPAAMTVPIEDGGFLADKRCRVCSAKLTVRESVIAGIGPTCAKR